MNKINKFLWFVTRPDYYSILFEIFKNKFFFLKKENSLNICKKKCISDQNFRKIFLIKLKKFNINEIIDLKKSFEIIKKNSKMLRVAQNFGNKRIIFNKKNFVSKSGASNISIIYEIIRRKKPKNILETGVAYGWSSYVILLGILHNKIGKLISVDLPYPLLNEKKNIGILVPKHLRRNWTLIFDKDYNGIKKAIKKFNLKIDLFHYDSDKNYSAKLRNLFLVWKHLSKDGIIICDDINDNFAFFHFVENIKKKYYVIKTNNKYIGILVND